MKPTRILFATCISLVTMGSAFGQWEYTLNSAMGSVMYVSDSVPEPCCFSSGYAFQAFNLAELTDTDSEYTVFVPTDEAVDELMALMNLNQWDLIGFSDLPTALNYHIVPGTWLAEDLVDGMVRTLMRMGLINLDLMDLRAIVNQSGEATMLVGIGRPDDPKGILESALKAPLAAMDVGGAKGCLIQVEGGLGMTIGQVNAVADLFTSALDADAIVILGARVSEDLVDTIRVVTLLSGIRPA